MQCWVWKEQFIFRHLYLFLFPPYQNIYPPESKNSLSSNLQLAFKTSQMYYRLSPNQIWLSLPRDSKRNLRQRFIPRKFHNPLLICFSIELNSKVFNDRR